MIVDGVLPADSSHSTRLPVLVVWELNALRVHAESMVWDAHDTRTATVLCPNDIHIPPPVCTIMLVAARQLADAGDHVAYEYDLGV